MNTARIAIVDDDPSFTEFLQTLLQTRGYTVDVFHSGQALIDKLEGKPALMRLVGNLPPLSRATGTSDDVIRDRLRMLMAVEDGVGDLLTPGAEGQGGLIAARQDAFGRRHCDRDVS